MIRVRGVSKRYVSGGRSTVALDNVSFDIGPEQCLAIVGPSGSGKSTLLSIVGTLLRPDSGSVKLDGVDLTSLSDAKAARFRACELGVVLQSAALLPSLTVLENLALAAGFKELQATQKDLLCQLERVGLGDRADAFIDTLSLGEQRRVVVTRALIGNPSIVLCDEPTNDLDDTNADIVLGLIEDQARRGATALVVSHRPLPGNLFQHVLTLDSGTVVGRRCDRVAIAG